MIHGNNSELVLSATISETLKSTDILRRDNTTKWNHVSSLSKDTDTDLERTK